MAKKVNMRGVTFVDKRTGKIITVLNPAQKGRKYAVELKHGKALTNSLQRKRTRTGAVKTLSKSAKAYRAGYLDARKDNAKAYKAKKKRQYQRRKR